jgi:hypothetical protein
MATSLENRQYFPAFAELPIVDEFLVRGGWIRRAGGGAERTGAAALRMQPLAGGGGPTPCDATGRLQHRVVEAHMGPCCIPTKCVTRVPAQWPPMLVGCACASTQPQNTCMHARAPKTHVKNSYSTHTFTTHGPASGSELLCRGGGWRHLPHKDVVLLRRDRGRLPQPGATGHDKAAASA